MSSQSNPTLVTNQQLRLIRMSLEAYETMRELANSRGFGTHGVSLLLTTCAELNIVFTDARPKIYKELRVWSKPGVKVNRRYGRLPVDYLLGVKKQFEITNYVSQNRRLNGQRIMFHPDANSIEAQIGPVLEAIGLEFLRPYPEFPKPPPTRVAGSRGRDPNIVLVGM